MSRLEIETLLEKRYSIKSELGQGGMGKVYLARDQLLERNVAIKVLSQSELGKEGRSRLLHEAQAIAQLNHPNIVTIHDAGQVDDIPYIVMEHVEGKNLREITLYELEIIISIVCQICNALEHAHKHGIIHRDLKPENVLIDKDGTAKLMDFGLARSMASRYTIEGTIIGTVFYLAPEFALGKDFDGRADLYALGVMIYELTTGELPFMGTDPLAVISQHLYAPVVPPSVKNEKIPPLLEELILRLLQKDSVDRPSSASEVLEWLNSPGILDPKVSVGIKPTILERIAQGRLIGREKELEQARTLWRMTLSGQGQILLISGEPGIGKTRFLREMMTHAEVSGGWTLVGESHYGGGAPYEAFAQIVHQGMERSIAAGIEIPDFILADLLTLTPEFRGVFKAVPPNPSLDPKSEQRRLKENVSSYFQSLSDKFPLLIALDDAHWADSGTLAMLQKLARRIERKRMMILTTYREVELDEALPFHETMLTLTRDSSPTRLKLSRLNRDQTQVLLQTIFSNEITTEFLDGIYRETEGNPFFIEEVCKALVESRYIFFESGQWHQPKMEELEIPQSIRVAIQSRVGRLSEQEQDILRLAALIGREFDFSILVEACNTEEEVLISALENAEKGQLIYEIPHKKDVVFRFSHALFSTTLTESIRTLRRRKMHKQVAQAIEKVQPHDFETLAYHYGEAGSLEKALNYFSKAGDRASDAFANQEAEVYFISAYDLAEDDLTQAHLLKKLGIVQERMAQYQKSIQSWRKSMDHFRSLGHMDEIADLYARCGRIYWEMVDSAGSLRYCLQGLNEVGDETVGPGLAKLLAETGRAYYFSGKLEEVAPYCRRALDMAQSCQVTDVQAEALITLGILPNIPAEEAIPSLEQAIQITENAGHWESASRAHNNLAVLLAYSLGDIHGSIEHQLRAAEIAHLIGAINNELFYRSSITGWVCMMGDFERTEQNIQALHDLNNLLEGWHYGVYLLKLVEASLLRFQGHLEKSISLYEELQQAALSGEDPQASAGIKNFLSEVLIENGDLDLAIPLLEEAISLGDTGALYGGIWPRAMLSIIQAEKGNFLAADQLLKDAQHKYIEMGSRAFDELWLKTGQTRTAFLEKEWEKAWESAETTLLLLEKYSFRWYRARLLLDWGIAYHQRGREGDLQGAETRLKEAISEFNEMGIPRYADAALDYLKRIQTDR